MEGHRKALGIGECVVVGALARGVQCGLVPMACVSVLRCAVVNFLEEKQ